MVTLAAALISLAGSILSLFIASRLALQKERRQLLWSKELDRMFELEELAGGLAEDLGSYRPIPQDMTDLAARLLRLERAAGRFARYPDICQAIRDLHNALARVLDAKQHHEDYRAIRDELGTTFRKLLDACDAVVGRKNVVGRKKRKWITLRRSL